MVSYKVVRCPNCRNRFITTSYSRVRCMYCGRSFKVADHTIYMAYTWDEARIFFYRGR